MCSLIFFFPPPYPVSFPPLSSTLLHFKSNATFPSSWLPPLSSLHVHFFIKIFCSLYHLPPSLSFFYDITHSVVRSGL
jgi:hypothetical protein